uniref:Uncharacterized protein n=1 Tax=Panagrolaimus davidi TaxID=227884 RepID=A0A914QCC5_9BILA
MITPGKTSMKNNNTISLHIAAYEGYNESCSTDKRLAETLAKLKLGHGQIGKVNGNLSSAIQHAFEFPRQQTDGSREPAIMQFKVSQRLLDTLSSTSNSGLSPASPLVVATSAEVVPNSQINDALPAEVVRASQNSEFSCFSFKISSNY